MSELNFYLSRTIGHRFWHTPAIPDRVCAGMKTILDRAFIHSHTKCGDFEAFSVAPIPRDGGGGVLPYRRLMGVCRWMGSHFQ